MLRVLKYNIITATDSYKVTHWKQYPKGTQYVRAYFEARLGARYPSTTFFGLQYFLQCYFGGVQVTREKIDIAAEQFKKHFFDPEGKLFNREGWEYILKVHNGYLPLAIRAVKEGQDVPVSNVLMTVENTDPNCAWLVNYVETLLVELWYPITVATRSKYLKGVIGAALEKSGDPSTIQFKLHDFGFRGVSSRETAALGGAAHLINFWGTDTFAGIELLEDFYEGSTQAGGLGYPGYSIPAYEHSTITSWGVDGEVDCVANALKQFPEGLLAMVIDSYDAVNFVAHIMGTVHRDAIMARNGTFVARPDSGDPHVLIPHLLKIMWDKFGGTTNEKGYKVLDPHVRMIQGDGIDDVTVGTILEAVMNAGFSADNLAFGSGGGLLQKMDRDTQRFAFKCSQIVVDGKEHDVYKAPKTDVTKSSKKGYLHLMSNDGNPKTYITVNSEELKTKDFTGMHDELIPVFMNGSILRTTNLKEIRELAASK
jgi:nicotinamide phosphoribosyltransferase